MFLIFKGIFFNCNLINKLLILKLFEKFVTEVVLIGNISLGLKEPLKLKLFISFKVLILFVDSSNKQVNIEQALNCVSFLVKVPVLSLKIYFTDPNSPSNSVLKHFIF